MNSESALSDAHWHYDARSPEGERLGIAFSGGGIRSAVFGLGVYQRLAAEGVYEQAEYVSAVSGGGYLAAALAIAEAFCPPELRGVSPRPWERGSVEEARLRSNLHYLAPGGSGRLWLGANALYGFLVNLAPLLIGVFIAGRLAGSVLRVVYPGLGSDGPVDLSAASRVAVAVGLLIVAAVVVVGFRRFRDKRRRRKRDVGSASEQAVATLLTVAACLVGGLLVLPGLVHGVAQLAASDTGAALGLGHASPKSERLGLELAALLVAVVIGGVALWLLRRRQAPVFRAGLAILASVLLAAIPFVFAAQTGASREWQTSRDLPVLVIATVILILFGVLAHNRRYSMHLFYRERLQDAFATCRVRTNGRVDVESIPYATAINLTDVVARNSARSDITVPSLVLCAAVAARGSEVPSKTWAASFTFTGDRSGNPRLGLDISTRDLEREDWFGGGLTLPSIIAISGAALSPLMGRVTLPAFRFLLAVLNVRLGVWIRKPDRETAVDRELVTPDDRSRTGKAYDWIVKGWREPGALYVLREGLGLADTHRKYVYVSDGGHWENLGLTELLRRRCTKVIVVDASRDPGLGDISRAISVARAELGVEVRLNLHQTLPGDDGLAREPVAVGSFEYPDGERGDLYYARAVVWDQAPEDLRFLARTHGVFPNHSTSNQFLSGEMFDAYRALGWAVGSQVVERPEFEMETPR